MPHVIWHCGLVGAYDPPQLGGDVSWPKFEQGIVAWQLFDTAIITPEQRRKLERKLMRRAFNIAERMDDVLGGGVGAMEMVDGQYCAIGVGARGPSVVIPAFQIGRDGLVTYAFESESIGHAEASALDIELSIERYEMYLDVHRVTGGEIVTY